MDICVLLYAIVLAILVNYMWLKKIHERVGLAPKWCFGSPGPYRGWGPQTPKFFWEVQEVPIGPPGKIKGLVQLFHVFF